MRDMCLARDLFWFGSLIYKQNVNVGITIKSNRYQGKNTNSKKWIITDNVLPKEFKIQDHRMAELWY